MHGDVSTNAVLFFLGVGFVLNGLDASSNHRAVMGALFGATGILSILCSSL